jgi:hypothetical protein
MGRPAAARAVRRWTLKLTYSWPLVCILIEFGRPFRR